MFGHEKVMMNGNGGNGGGGSSAGSTIAAVVAAQTHAQSQAVSTATVTTSASTSAVTAATTPVGASNSSALAGITSNGMNGANQNANNHRASDTNKRRKSKNRNSTVPNSSTYSKEHLDAWLETCLKDASSTQLSSSSEFLDYNPTNNFQSGKKAQQQQQRQQPNPYQLQQQHFSQSYQQQFGNNPRQPIYPAPFSQGFQKSVPTFLKNSLNNRFSLNANTLLQHTDGSVEFASLPPIVNLLGSENENNSTDVLDGSSNPNISRGFRFSDPCLLNPSDNDSKVSGQETPDRRNFKNPAEMENNKFFAALMEQINLLHETNSKICRNLHETKVDIEALKHAPNWGLRHRRDSISGLSTHSQPLGFGFGTQSPAPTYHSGAYTPGMMTDVVREVKEAARVREDALLSRVKAMVEERSWSMGENSLRLMRDVEELRSQIQSLRADRKETNKRVAHLETENKYMRQMLASIINNRSTDIIYENEALRSTPQRKIFPTTDVRQSKRANSLNLHYGVIHQADEEEEEEPMSGLHIAEQGPGGVTPMESSDLRNSFSSSDGQISIVNSTSKNGWPDEVSSKRVQKPPITEEASELRKELQEAIAARKQADNRIIALENMVKKLQVKLPNGGDERMAVVVGGNNQMMMGGSKNGGGSGAAAAPAYSFHTSSLSSSSSPAPKVKSEHSTINALPTALISSASSGSQIFNKNSSNQMHLAHQQQLQLQKQQQQHLQHQQQLQLQQQQQQQLQLQQQQQQQQNHLPAKLSLAGPITDL